ncbi:MAG: DNA methyltransferase [Chloroflexota bacterium]
MTAAQPDLTPPWAATAEEVAEFLRINGWPYDATMDAYSDPGPFAQSVKAGKNSAIYNAHSYHTKVPPEGIKPYLLHYTQPGDVVLDPFCGSGMTGVACLLAGRPAILNDLSPAATHIAYNYCHPVDPAALKQEFERIRAAVQEEFAWLYGTTCDRGHPAIIQYTVWSDVHSCRGCNQEIVLWEAAVDPAKGDVQETFSCPHCGRGPYKKTELPLLRSEPVLTVYECQGGCHPARGHHPTTAAEKARLAEIEAADIPYWYPTDAFDPTREMWRGGHRDHGITRVCDFWTKRNL